MTNLRVTRQELLPRRQILSAGDFPGQGAIPHKVRKSGVARLSNAPRPKAPSRSNSVLGIKKVEG